MADTEDDGFIQETLKGLEGDTTSVELPKEEPKKDEETAKQPEEPKPAEKVAPTAADDKKAEENLTPPKTPETPATPEAPQPLTKDDVKSVVNDLLTGERSSSKELDTTTQEVLEAYYPGGLSNTLIDESSGKELRTPADVVEASGGQMSIDEAAQWLMNEQYNLDTQVAKIKEDAKAVAETTVNFRRDAKTVLQKYDPLFKAYPQIQNKVYQKLMKQVKVDSEKGVILSAPDVMEYYDDFLEPYQLAFEQSTQQPATNPTTPPEPKATAEDRMDISGDGGTEPVNDPNDFAQQVKKELARKL